MIKAALGAIAVHLPERVLTNEDLAAEYPDWTVDKIEGKTGITRRHVAAEGECASDLGVAAARKLFGAGACAPADIDFVLLCTQSPDHFLPTTACLVQDRLGIPTAAGALDFNLGCSGFVYGLGLAKGLIETGQARRVLLLTAETYSKFINPGDRSVRTLFGDGAAATLVEAVEAPGDEPLIGPILYGTDGRGGPNLIVPRGGLRARGGGPAEAAPDAAGNVRSADDLFMDGAEVFAFTSRTVPGAVRTLLERAGLQPDDVHQFVFHQANRFMLEHLRKKSGLPKERFVEAYASCGNTVSASIPIALDAARREGRLRSGERAMLMGFGVGYSWAGALVRWP